MSEEEKTVFEILNENIAAMVEQLKLANEAIIVAAIELYEARRELTDVLKKINTTLGTMAGTEWKPETTEVSTVQEAGRYEEMVFPKSTPQEAKKKVTK